jgi:hypothetical protein
MPLKSVQAACNRAEARWRRAATAVRRASDMNANQLWKCANTLHAVAPLAYTKEQGAELEDRAERLEGLAWDKALRHQLVRCDLP